MNNIDLWFLRLIENDPGTLKDILKEIESNVWALRTLVLTDEQRKEILIDISNLVEEALEGCG